MKFEAGKTYRFVDSSYAPDWATFTKGDNMFVCHYVGSDGNAWTCDILFQGRLPLDVKGWAIAEPEDLKLGYVVEVTV